MKRVFLKGWWGFGALLLGIPSMAAGAALITNYSDVIKVINEVRDWLYGILLALAVVFIIISAYFFLTAAGDPKKIERAKNQLIYSVIAVVVAILARAIIALVQVILH